MTARTVGDVAALRDLPLEYPVFVETGALAALGDVVHAFAPAHRIGIIADATVAQAHGDAIRASFGGMRVDLLTVAPGEQEKTRERWAQLTDALFALEFGRDSTIVAIGGGVVCDLAGFVAATFMRGVPIVQVPTTLLAMVDASVGGKTAVDPPAGKNLVGAFHNPKAVLIDPLMLRTLPASVLRAGLAEMIKHGVIADAAYLEAILHALPEIALRGADSEALPSLVANSVRIKAAVVAEDTREDGLRQILNFGHTIAHAIERLVDYQVSHGEAVAVGMVVEGRIAESIGLAKPGLALAIADSVRRAGLPTSIDGLSLRPELRSRVSPLAVVRATRGDKKARGGLVRYALPRQVGEMEAAEGAWSVPVLDEVVERALA
jgi:3-dehydroquinate synthase